MEKGLNKITETVQKLKDNYDENFAKKREAQLEAMKLMLDSHILEERTFRNRQGEELTLQIKDNEITIHSKNELSKDFLDVMRDIFENACKTYLKI